MSNPQKIPQVFDDLVAAPMTVVHHFVSELHLAAAHACASIAGAHLSSGLLGTRTLHPGAGFGGDARIAAMWGVREAIGIESGPHQVAFDKAVRELPDDALAALLRNDPATVALYPSTAIEFAVESLLEERRHFRRLPWETRETVRHGDVLTSDLLGLADGQPVDAVIGNFMFHWLLNRGDSLAAALDRFASVVLPGGVAVFSVPYQIVQAKDPAEEKLFRSRIAQDTPLYRGLVSRLLPQLQKNFSAQILEMASNRMEPILVKDAEAEAGSRTFDFVQTQTRYFAAKPSLVADALRGGALYEAVFRTGLPAVQLAGHVASATNETLANLTPAELAEPTSTFIRFYVFRRNLT